VPDACAEALYTELEKMLFAEDVKLFWRDEPWSFEPGDLPGSGERIFPLGHAVSGVIWPSAVPGFRGALDLSSLPAEFHFERISALVPWPALDWEEAQMALEAGALPWIDRDKGCYPGQEVVEKSLNIGHPPRVLQAYEGNESVIAGAKLAEATVTSVASKSGITRILARVAWNKRGEDLPGFRKIKSHW
jgi:folate-binding protein YgfZ